MDEQPPSKRDENALKRWEAEPDSERVEADSLQEPKNPEKRYSVHNTGTFYGMERTMENKAAVHEAQHLARFCSLCRRVSESRPTHGP